MKYLKLTNIPLNLMNTSRYGGNGKNVPWIACGFNILMVRTKAVQFTDSSGDFQQYLPITDEVRAAEILALVLEDTAPFDELTCEIIDAEHDDLVALRVAAQPVE